MSLRAMADVAARNRNTFTRSGWHVGLEEDERGGVRAVRLSRPGPGGGERATPDVSLSFAPRVRDPDTGELVPTALPYQVDSRRLKRPKRFSGVSAAEYAFRVEAEAVAQELDLQAEGAGLAGRRS